jgi:heterodisulfide reductase subunit A-like polyferredoxin
MSQTNYEAMSTPELRQYFISHREDKVALQAYLDRINLRPRQVVAHPDDPDFDEKILALIRQKLVAAQRDRNQQQMT